ncbi:MAG: hypothetical protein HUJ70_15750, partial [Pseudobutyrivibrio sp.]|nr:hypothetical protein [Pseudobutyrivibrio sp.]
MKERFLTLCHNIGKFVGAHRFEVISASGCALAAVVGVTVILTANASSAEEPAEPEPVVEETVEVTPEEVQAEPEVYVAKFKSCFITSDSVEKDLTIYISDENDETIKGTSFNVKLISNDDAKNLADYISSIESLNQQLGDGVSQGQEITDEDTITLCQDKEVA